jgi:hypothetical protein
MPPTSQSLKTETSYLGARLREPSTYAGLGGILIAAGLFLGLHPPEGTAQAITMIGEGLGGILGGIAILLPEGK